MHLGPLVRYYTCLAISRVSSLAAFDGGQKTQNESLPSEGEKADFFKKKQSLTCHARKVKFSSAKCVQNMREGLCKRQWARKLRENLSQRKTNYMLDVKSQQEHIIQRGTRERQKRSS
jgi:hypothetical protein